MAEIIDALLTRLGRCRAVALVLLTEYDIN